MIEFLVRLTRGVHRRGDLKDAVSRSGSACVTWPCQLHRPLPGPWSRAVWELSGLSLRQRCGCCDGVIPSDVECLMTAAPSPVAPKQQKDQSSMQQPVPLAPAMLPQTIDYRLKTALLGKPLTRDSLRHQRLSKVLALGVLASDCISSSAYGTEEMLIIL